MRWLLLIWLLACTITAAKGGAKKAAALGKLRAMPISELKRFLAERGKECRGCSEKDHFVEAAYKHRKKKIKEEHHGLNPEASKPGNVKSKKGFEFSKEQFMEQLAANPAFSGADKAHTAKLQEKLWADFSKKLEEGLLDAENNVLTYNADVQAPFEGSWWQIGGYIAMIIMMSISVSLSVL